MKALSGPPLFALLMILLGVRGGFDTRHRGANDLCVVDNR